MAKTFVGSKQIGEAVIAELDEARAQIKELERQLRKMGETAEAAELNHMHQRSQADTYRGYWEAERAKVAQYQNIIATMDLKAVETATSALKSEIHRKNRDIETLREDLHRCLGWINAQVGKQPGISHVRPHDRFDDMAFAAKAKAYTGDKVPDEEAPF